MTGIVHFYSKSKEQKDPIIPSFPFHSSYDYEEGASCAGGRYSVLSYPEKCVSEERKNVPFLLFISVILHIREA